MKEVNGKAVGSLIELIYTGVIKIDNDNVMELLAAADYLQLDDVRQFCLEFVESTINEGTCCANLFSANLCRQEEHREKALNFIINNFKHAKNKKALFSKPDLISCVIKLNREQIRDSKFYQILIDWTKMTPEIAKMTFHSCFSF